LSGNGGEYTSAEFKKFCKIEGISRHYTTPARADQNEVADQMNMTLCEKAKSMRLNSGLPKEFWAEAINMACYVVNLASPTAMT